VKRETNFFIQPQEGTMIRILAPPVCFTGGLMIGNGKVIGGQLGTALSGHIQGDDGPGI
jgi:hypothetical protein